MNQMVPFAPIFINVLCIVLSFLNACFLGYIWFENRKSQIQEIYQKKEIQNYIEFSAGAFIYVFAQAVILISNSFPVNLLFHRIQHVGLALGVIAFIRLPRHIFGIEKENRVLKAILIGIVMAMTPVFFTDWFLLPTEHQLGWVIQGKPGPVYWILIGILMGVFVYNIIRTLIFAIAKYAQDKHFRMNEKSFIAGSLFLLVMNIIAIIKLNVPDTLPFLENSSTSIGLSGFSLIITVILTYRYGLTFKSLSQKQEELLHVREHVEKEYEDILSTIVEILEKDDLYTAGHSRRVMQISMEIAKKMELNNSIIDKIQITGILHDIGKLGVSKLVLNKPGKLTDDEFLQIKRHSELGFDIVSTYKPLYEIATYVKAHHEKLNGEGYPDRLVDEKIPGIAKIIAVADVYDALSSKRPYREALSQEKCLQIMDQMAGNREIEKNILAKLAKIIPYLKLED
ncbi:MAG: hypothetical protein A2Y33_08385 [Spirochaetes bacterium GWF1_51_8]|nr:MAG: hypothetical protein A2Y33_08385 [Spirochaetes bacterium GWF1_51_8]